MPKKSTYINSAIGFRPVIAAPIAVPTIVGSEIGVSITLSLPNCSSKFFVAPYANDNAARAANGGAYPPDLSLITKARGGGANYLYSLLIGYKEPPESIEVREGLHYNKYYSGNLIAMPQPLYEDGVEYADGTNATIEQMAADVTEFLTWAAEPEMEARKRTGIAAISFLLIMAVLSYIAKLQIWANVKKKQA